MYVVLAIIACACLILSGCGTAILRPAANTDSYTTPTPTQHQLLHQHNSYYNSHTNTNTDSYTNTDSNANSNTHANPDRTGNDRLGGWHCGYSGGARVIIPQTPLQPDTLIGVEQGRQALRRFRLDYSLGLSWRSLTRHRLRSAATITVPSIQLISAGTKLALVKDQRLSVRWEVLGNTMVSGNTISAPVVGFSLRPYWPTQVQWTIHALVTEKCITCTTSLARQPFPDRGRRAP